MIHNEYKKERIRTYESILHQKKATVNVIPFFGVKTKNAKIVLV